MTEQVKDRAYYLANRHNYEFPKFTIKTDVGNVEFVVAIPKKKYDGVAVLQMFEEYLANKKPPEGGSLDSPTD